MHTITQILLLVLLGGVAASAQGLCYSGEVRDEHGEELAFVTVLADMYGDSLHRPLVLTDIEGHFTLCLQKPPRALLFRCVGFDVLRLDSAFLQKNADKSLRIKLRERNNELHAVEIRAGENPADRIIRLAVANRDRHDPERRPAYTCLIYGKQSLRPNINFQRFAGGRDSRLLAMARDSTVRLSSRQQRQVERAVRNRDGIANLDKGYDALLIESVVRRSFLFPGQLKQEVLLNRVSGFQDFPAAAVTDVVQPFTFHRDYIALVDKAFVNPISANSSALYFFNLEDTLYQGHDTVYVISFHPQRGRVFDALQGTLFINSDGWALQNVRAEPAQNSNLWLKIEQQYQRVDGRGWGVEGGGQSRASGPDSTQSLRLPPSTAYWFPEQMNFEMAFGDSSGVQMRMEGRSRVTEVNFHPDLNARDFDPEIPLVFGQQANTRSDSAWAPWHGLTPLSAREQRTFAAIDSLGEVYRFGRLEWGAKVMSSGVVPLWRKLLGLDMSKFLTLNEFEQVRLGLGLTTAPQRPYQLPHRFDAAAWTGYGFGDRRWKYGGALTWRSGRMRNIQVSVSAVDSIAQSGGREGWLDFRGGFDGSIYARTMNRLQDITLSLRLRPLKNLALFSAVRQQAFTPEYAYTYTPESDRPASNPFHFAETVLSARYAWGELSNELMSANWQLVQPVPVLELIWEHGWKGVFQSAYAYDRFVVALYQQRFIRRLGRMNWRLEAGQVFGRVPFPKLFSISPPSGEGLVSAFAVANTLQTIDTLLVGDRFLHLYFSQQVGNVLYRKRWSAPYLTLLQNAAWGDLSHPERHVLGFRSLQKPLFESGIRVDDMLRINVLRLGYIGGGVAAFYGWGPFWDGKRKVAVRVAVRWSF